MPGSVSNSYAELDEQYFCEIKFSTQVLISVWKIGSRSQLTALSSTACSCLHNFSAVVFLHAGDFGRRSSMREAQGV
jgi:hypothetical protein